MRKELGLFQSSFLSFVKLYFLLTNVTNGYKDMEIVLKL